MKHEQPVHYQQTQSNTTRIWWLLVAFSSDAFLVSVLLLTLLKILDWRVEQHQAKNLLVHLHNRVNAKTVSLLIVSTFFTNKQIM